MKSVNVESQPIAGQYLGDGLYAEFDKFQIKLFTERMNGGVHEVFLDPNVLLALFRFVEKTMSVKISISGVKNEDQLL